MLIDLVSDLHVDKWGGPDSMDWASARNHGSDTLVICGDISNHHEDVVEVVRRAREVYKVVLVVDGNHDHYELSMVQNLTLDKSLEELRRSIEAVGGTFIGGGGSYRDGSVQFIGAMGWYNFGFCAHAFTPQLSKEIWWGSSDLTSTDHLGGSNDRHLKFGDQSPELLAEQDAAALEALVTAAQDDESVEIIVVNTHVIPHEGVMAWDRNDPWNGAYGNPLLMKVLEADQKGKIKVWTFGHTHTHIDRTIDGVRFVCMPRGYKHDRQNKHFCVMQIDTDEEPYASIFGEIEE